jgi:hypothetical protein
MGGFPMPSALNGRCIIISILVFQSLFVPAVVAQSQQKHLAAVQETAIWLTLIEHLK